MDTVYLQQRTRVDDYYLHHSKYVRIHSLRTDRRTCKDRDFLIPLERDSAILLPLSRRIDQNGSGNEDCHRCRVNPQVID